MEPSAIDGRAKERARRRLREEQEEQEPEPRQKSKGVAALVVLGEHICHSNV